MWDRQPQTARVVRRRHGAAISIAAPGDFVCADTASAIMPAQALPYCLDFLRARAVYVTGIAPNEAQQAAFYYLHLRRHAQNVLRVPIEHGALNAASSPDPVFLFSPGRCGSTLLSRVLDEAGIASVSEPDFYTQVASWFWSRRANPLAAPFHRAMWAMSADLTAALGRTPVVKLRAECARAPQLFVRDPATPSLVLLRGFESWSRSTARTFGAGPAKTVAKYMTALRCYAWLRCHRRCLLLRYEDWLSDPDGAAEVLGGFLGRPIPSEAVARAFKVPSQRGTPLEGRVRPGWQAKWDAARRLWHTPRLVSARQRLDLPGAWD